MITDSRPGPTTSKTRTLSASGHHVYHQRTLFKASLFQFSHKSLKNNVGTDVADLSP